MEFTYDFISEYTNLAQSDERKAIQWIQDNRKKLDSSIDEFIINIFTRNALYADVFQKIIYKELKRFIKEIPYDSTSVMCYNFLTNCPAKYQDIEDFLLMQDNSYSVQYIITQEIDVPYNEIFQKVQNILDKCTPIKFMPLYNTIHKMPTKNKELQLKLQNSFDWTSLLNKFKN